VADCCLFLKLKLSPISSLVAGSRSSPTRLVLYPFTPANHHRHCQSKSWDSSSLIQIASAKCIGSGSCSTLSWPFSRPSQNQNNQSIGTRCRFVHLLQFNCNPLLQSMRIVAYDRCSSKGCEAVFAKVDWFPPSILPKKNNSTLVLSRRNSGTSYRRSMRH
jgi:hypothetical protein